MPNRKLAAFTIIALIIIEIATVASHWGDVKARRPDFAALYSSAQLLRGVQDAAVPSAEAPQGGMRPDTLHPPFETALFVPLSFFSYTTAFILWLGCNLVMLWAVPLLLWRELGALQREFHFIAIVYGSMYPVLVCLVQGQDAILLLLLLTLSYRAAKSDQDFLSGALLALSLFKFQVVIPIALPLVAAKRWRVIAGFASVASVLAVVTVALIGIQNALRYASFVVHLGAQSSAVAVDDPALMPNLRGLVINVLERVFSPGAITILVITVSVLILGLLMRWVVINGSADRSLRYAVFVLAACVTSYHFFPHNACVLLLPILLSADAVLSAEIALERWMFSIAVLAIYLAPNLLPLGVAMPLLGLASILLLIALVRLVHHKSLLALGSR